MKPIVIIIFILILAGSIQAGIVNNSTSSVSTEDSLSVVFYSLDSLGNPTTADSVFVLVVGPSGVVVFRDSMTAADSRVTSITIRSKQFYSFKEQVSNIDGAGADGAYSLTILAKLNSGGLLTPNRDQFQIVSSELSDQLAMITDSIIVKGGAVDSNRTELGADSVSVGRWVWDVPQSGHNVSGSFGRYLDTEVSGLSSGGGAFSYTVVVFDSTIDQVVPHVGLAVRNIDQSSLIAVGTSDVFGQVAFNLNTDSFVVVVSGPGYVFETYDTIVVSGTGTDTVFADQFDPGAPALPAFCRVWGYLYSSSGQPEAEVVVGARIPSGITTYGWAIISPTTVSDVTDTTGYFALDLLPSDSLGVSPVPYEISISRRDGTILRQQIMVPDSATWRLTW